MKMGFIMALPLEKYELFCYWSTEFCCDLIFVLTNYNKKNWVHRCGDATHRLSWSWSHWQCNLEHGAQVPREPGPAGRALLPPRGVPSCSHQAGKRVGRLLLPWPTFRGWDQVGGLCVCVYVCSWFYWICVLVFACLLWLFVCDCVFVFLCVSTFLRVFTFILFVLCLCFLFKIEYALFVNTHVCVCAWASGVWSLCLSGAYLIWCYLMFVQNELIAKWLNWCISSFQHLHSYCSRFIH